MEQVGVLELGPMAAVEALVRPRGDQLEYRFVVLPNNIKAVLVHDPVADKAAASMDICVGSLLDPPEFPGMAHFLEHMLFYSSRKYPEEDAYSKFMAEHGGTTNAWTAVEDTNYIFDVNAEHLEPALDRFAQFFIGPLISTDGVDRELHAVDSEHSNNRNTDNWRQSQLMKHLANSSHPFHAFHTGNLETLSVKPKAAGLNVRDAVAAFYEKYYSANLMRLAVYGREPLDVLEAMVREKFAAVVDKGLEKPKFSPDVLLPEHLGQLIKAVPQRDGRILELSWGVVPSAPVYQTAPHNFLSFLLGHEGPGSACALLKRQGLITSLVAGEGGSSISSRSFFYVKMELTTSGHKQVPRVAATILRYLDVLRGVPADVMQRLFTENQALQRMRFDFADKQQPYHYVTSLSLSSHHYPDNELLLAMHAVPTRYDPQVVDSVLREMTAATVRVYWACKDEGFLGSSEESEPWYGTRYSVQPIPDDWLREWDSPASEETSGQLHVPDKNTFIAEDFTLHKDPSSPSEPVVIFNTPVMRVFHKLDHTFDSPKGCVFLDLQCPAAYVSPEAAVMTCLLAKCITDHLNEELYAAEVAGLHQSISNSLTGMSLTAFGYNDKLLDLALALVSKLTLFQVDPDRFAIVKEQLHKEYVNMRYQQPYQVAMYRSDVLLQQRRWQVEEYLQVLPDISAEDIMAHLPRLLSRSFMEILVVGNLQHADTLRASEAIQSALQSVPGSRPLFPTQHKDTRIVKLPQGLPNLLSVRGPNPDNDNSAISIMHQVGPDQARSNALAQLLVHISKREAFYQLRTKEQLGYIVSLSFSRQDAVSGLLFILQSNAYSARYLADRVDAFLQLLQSILEGLSPSDFIAAVEELAKAKLEKPKKMYDLANRWWAEVQDGSHMFQRKEIEVAELRLLSHADLLAFARSVLLSPASRRRLAVHVRGNTEEQALVTAAAAAAAPAPAAADEGAAPAEGAAGAAEPGGRLAQAAGNAGQTPAGCNLDAAIVPEQQQQQQQQGQGQAEHLVECVWAFKRGAEVWPGARSQGFTVVTGVAQAAPDTQL